GYAEDVIKTGLQAQPAPGSPTGVLRKNLARHGRRLDISQSGDRVRRCVDGGVLIFITADQDNVLDGPERQAHVAIGRLKVLHGQVRRVSIAAGRTVRRAVGDDIVVVFVPFVITSGIDGDAAEGIPSGADGIFLEPARFIRQGEDGGWSGGTVDRVKAICLV